MSEVTRHLYEGDSRGKELRAVSLCRKEWRDCSPVALTRMQREADPVCPACLAVQVRRLGGIRRGVRDKGTGDRE